MSLQVFTDSYIECAVWADCGTDHETHEADFSTDAQDMLERQARDFYAPHESDIESIGADQCGHDFWLTRNGHGAGFWDRDGFDRSEALQRLDAAARAAGGCDLYLGDDGTIYGTESVS